MPQSHKHQIGMLFDAAGGDPPVITGVLTNATIVSDYMQSDVTCNVSSSYRKRRRDEAMIPLSAPEYQQLSTSAGAIGHPLGFPVSTGLSFPVLESAGPSTSGVSSASYLPLGSDVSPELISLLYQQSNEFDALVRNQVMISPSGYTVDVGSIDR